MYTYMYIYIYIYIYVLIHIHTHISNNNSNSNMNSSHTHNGDHGFVPTVRGPPLSPFALSFYTNISRTRCLKYTTVLVSQPYLVPPSCKT